MTTDVTVPQTDNPKLAARIAAVNKREWKLSQREYTEAQFESEFLEARILWKEWVMGDGAAHFCNECARDYMDHDGLVAAFKLHVSMDKDLFNDSDGLLILHCFGCKKHSLNPIEKRKKETNPYAQQQAYQLAQMQNAYATAGTLGSSITSPWTTVTTGSTIPVTWGPSGTFGEYVDANKTATEVTTQESWIQAKLKALGF